MLGLGACPPEHSRPRLYLQEVTQFADFPVLRLRFVGEGEGVLKEITLSSDPQHMWIAVMDKPFHHGVWTVWLPVDSLFPTETQIEWRWVDVEGFDAGQSSTKGLLTLHGLAVVDTLVPLEGERVFAGFFHQPVRGILNLAVPVNGRWMFLDTVGWHRYQRGDSLFPVFRYGAMRPESEIWREDTLPAGSLYLLIQPDIPVLGAQGRIRWWVYPSGIEG